MSVFSLDGRRELAHTVENHIGHIYQYVTLLLGMKPAQHEYKVMGLAPYARSDALDEAYEVFRDVLDVDRLRIVYRDKPGDLYFHFRDALEGHRFDAVAGAVQRFTEEILCLWARNCIAETGLDTLCFSGGVAQNIKACKRLMELAGVKDLSVCPAAGDTSLAMGACYHTMWERFTTTEAERAAVEPITDIYLGPAVDDAEVRRLLSQPPVQGNYEVREQADRHDIAQRLV